MEYFAERSHGAFLSAVLVLTLFTLIAAGVRLTAQQTAAIPVSVGEGYIVRDYEGYVTVYRESSNIPYEQTDIPTLTLPQADRTALNEGIALPDRASLEQLLEDYQG